MGLATALIMTLLVAIIFARPSSHRDWREGLERVANFVPVDEQQWTLHNMRAFSFDADGIQSKDWVSHSVNAADLEAVWFFVEPFPGNDLFGHSYLSFVFGGDTQETIAVSVEARMEKGESYSIWRGALRGFELSYVWSTEKDIHTRIAANLQHELLAYRLDLDPDQSIAILEHFIERTNDLSNAPRFYNTFTSNCTNELAKAVNDAYPGALPWHSSFILTGRSARHLHSLGYVLGESSFETLTSNASIAGSIVTHQALMPDEFSAAWRQALEEQHQTSIAPNTAD